MFGFTVTTCCGSTPQDNSYKTTWSDFYANNRLLMILKACKKSQGPDAELEDLVETTVSKVVPRLLANGHLKSPNGKDIVPVLVHGDLWSGNHGRGKIGSEGGAEEVVFDASACYAHSEFEFGIMGMFGGFGASFNREYHKIKPKDEPVEEWQDRVKLYEL
jgi:protein-ribulosamine 3-kinase